MVALTQDLLTAAEQPPGRKFPARGREKTRGVVTCRPMIRHIVMWKLRGPSQEERRSQAEQAKAALLGMLGKVPGLQQMEVGIGPGSADDESDLVLSSLHDSWQALKDYAVHPDHEPVKQLIGSLRTERRVIDFEV
jgi:hypothetical protein